MCKACTAHYQVCIVNIQLVEVNHTDMLTISIIGPGGGSLDSAECLLDPVLLRELKSDSLSESHSKNAI